MFLFVLFWFLFFLLGRLCGKHFRDVQENICGHWENTVDDPNVDVGKRARTATVLHQILRLHLLSSVPLLSQKAFWLDRLMVCVMPCAAVCPACASCDLYVHFNWVWPPMCECVFRLWGCFSFWVSAIFLQSFWSCEFLLFPLKLAYVIDETEVCFLMIWVIFLLDSYM